MRKSLLLIPVLAAFAAISAYGNSGEKGRSLARIDGRAFTEGDLSLRLAVHDDVRAQAVLADPEARRGEFESLLRTRLQALATLKSPQGKDRDARRKMASVDQRIFTQYYFETYINLQAGHTRSEIEAFYNAEPSRFADDSGKVLPFALALPRVVDTLIARKIPLDSVYGATKGDYRIRPWAEASVIRTGNRKQAEAALKALRGGAAFGATAKRYSDHPSKNSDGRIGRLNEGEFNDAFALQSVVDSLLFRAGTRLKPGQTSGIVPVDGTFRIVRVEAYTAEATPPLAEVRNRVIAAYVREYKARLSQEAVDLLKAKYQVRQISLQDKEPSEKEIRAYYDANKDQYEAPETYELYHVEAASEAKLTEALSSVKDLEGFKALASRLSENSLTRARQGHLGTVKRDFSLPYGVGMLPALFPALDEIENGQVAELIQNPTTQTWHAFWLVKKTPATLKSYDRVRLLVIQDLKANRIANVSPSDTLGVIGKTGKIVREEDVLFLRKEIPAEAQARYTRENLADFLMIWDVFTTETKALGMENDRKLRAMRLQGEDNYWANIYRDSILPKTWEEKPAVLEKTFKSDRALFTPDENAKDWKPFARDVAASRLITPADYEIEYNTYPERYMRDSVKLSFAEAKSRMFGNLKQTGYARLEAQVFEKLKKRFKVRIEDPTLNEPSLEPVAGSYKKAQDLHYERKLEPALNLYERLRVAYPKNAALQDSISFGMAQIYIEQERYPQALAEYRRVSYLYPNSPNDYKAMFMVGFIQAEHLRQDSVAVESFEAMLKKHPSSDLSDDADWMIRNIRSGGQLMPSLEDDADEEGGMSKEPTK